MQPEEEASERRQLDQKRFRVDTTINLAHILTTIALVLSIFSWGADLRAMVQKHEYEILEIKTSIREDRGVLREELRELTRKIDKISERVGVNGSQQR